jgi:hypothetical protein
MPLLSRPNRAPTVQQLLELAGRAGGKPLRSAEVVTLKGGIRALAAAAGSGAAAPAAPSPARASETELLLAAAVRLYAGVYGLTTEQAEAEVRAEAGL